MTENILLIPDTHYPLVDKRLWKTVLRVVEDTQPDEIIHLGDIMDYPQPSRWTKGTRAEFEGSVFQDSENAIRDIIEPLREVYDGRIGIHEGNHDLRPRVYMEKYAPALSQTDMFNFEKLLRFEDYGINKLPDFYDVAPGWKTTHGHLGGIRLNQIAGNTAGNGSKRISESIVMGHTHRAGMVPNTTGLGGKINTIVGMEVGHIMDLNKVTYLKGAAGNWQHALGWLTIEGKHVSPHVALVSAGRLTINGKVYKI